VSAPKQISTAEMLLILKEQCPDMSEMTVQAVLGGAVLQLRDGSEYQCPKVNDARATHHVVARPRKVGTKWIS
jgi:hypothetical protein